MQARGVNFTDPLARAGLATHVIFTHVAPNSEGLNLTFIEGRDAVAIANLDV